MTMSEVIEEMSVLEVTEVVQFLTQSMMAKLMNRRQKT